MSMYVSVKVKSGAKKESVTLKSADRFEISVCEKAERGQANKRITKILAEHFGAKMIIMIKGQRLPNKLFKVLEPISNLMSKENFQISSENNEFGGNISRSVDEKFVICSRNLKVLSDKP